MVRGPAFIVRRTAKRCRWIPFVWRASGLRCGIGSKKAEGSCAPNRRKTTYAFLCEKSCLLFVKTLEKCLFRRRFCTNLFFPYYTPQILSCQALQENLKSRAFPKSLLFGFGQANLPKSLEKEGILWYNIMRRPRKSREGCSIDGRVDSETDFPLPADCRNRQASFQSNEPERCGGYV